jgi:hypothetical protein
MIETLFASRLTRTTRYSSEVSATIVDRVDAASAFDATRTEITGIAAVNSVML